MVGSNVTHGISKKNYMGVVDLFAFPLLVTSLFTCMRTRNDQKQILSAVVAIGFKQLIIDVLSHATHSLAMPVP